VETLIFVTGNVNKGFEIEERFKREEISIEIIKMDFQ